MSGNVEIFREVIKHSKYDRTKIEKARMIYGLMNSKEKKRTDEIIKKTFQEAIKEGDKELVEEIEKHFLIIPSERERFLLRYFSRLKIEKKLDEVSSTPVGEDLGEWIVKEFGKSEKFKDWREEATEKLIYNLLFKGGYGEYSSAIYFAKRLREPLKQFWIRMIWIELEKKGYEESYLNILDELPEGEKNILLERYLRKLIFKGDLGDYFSPGECKIDLILKKLKRELTKEERDYLLKVALYVKKDLILAKYIARKYLKRNLSDIEKEKILKGLIEEGSLRAVEVSEEIGHSLTPEEIEIIIKRNLEKRKLDSALFFTLGELIELLPPEKREEWVKIITVKYVREVSNRSYFDIKRMLFNKMTNPEKEKVFMEVLKGI